MRINAAQSRPRYIKWLKISVNHNEKTANENDGINIDKK